MATRIKTKNGYARGVSCAKGHSGNRGLVHDHRGGVWVCQGCGEFHTRETVVEAQQALMAGRDHGENMAGGVYGYASCW